MFSPVLWAISIIGLFVTLYLALDINIPVETTVTIWLVSSSLNLTAISLLVAGI